MSRASVGGLLVLAVAVIVPGSRAAADAHSRFHGCADQSVTISAIPTVAVFDIGVRGISCSTAYRLIRGFPATLRPRESYRGYACHSRFSGALVAFDYLCIDGRRVYRFAVTSE